MLNQQPETRAVYCTDGGCDLWGSGSSTVWVALFYGLGQMGGKTVRTSWESHEKVIKNMRPPHTERPFVVCKGNDFMITITGDAKEIAALIEGLYGQRKNESNTEELRRSVGKILTEEHSKTHGIHIDGIYQQNGKINISKERMNTGWL